ncbi:MAG TPA: tRNA (adenosine(37)-N6)-threonylcarbamoyltransferase complex transferase subunit TsaD [Chloroflexi bacterium]|nr:tRNA (adenosine(37)-N6)-threonylcarbamoyltransferase complex transferase subunit TsaD [Chloroflexota bacterium]
MRILGIESSCDETAAAVVEDGRKLLSNVVASQIELHARYGGVFPEVASRQHIRTIYAVVQEALQQAHLSLQEIDAIAVTRGPGLAGSLVVGMNTAKGLALGSNLPLIGVNHLEGHVYSAWLHPDGEESPPPEFPLIVLLVSGGHTELNLVEGHLHYQRLGATLDDAAGEAFDKVARLLGLPYPGGPSIQKAAAGGNPNAFHMPRARLEGTWNFSFSGLKTAVLRTVREIEDQKRPLPVADLAASFQEAVVDVLVSKTIAAAEQFQAKSILVAGGVSANKELRDTILARSPVPVFIPPLSLCTDNAAMIATAGYYRFIHGQTDPLDLDVLPTWPLS